MPGNRICIRAARFPFRNIFRNNLAVILTPTILLIILSTAAISSSATPASITRTTQQAKLGIYMSGYFENANAPFSSTPVIVDTSNSMPSESGSYTIAAGSSAYLWTPQFSNPVAIPSGKLTLDLWTSDLTPAIDGSNSNSFNAAAGSVTITTTKPNDIIYAIIAIKSTSIVPSISAAGLTWNFRGSVIDSGGGATGEAFAFYAVSANPLASARINATLSSSASFGLTVFGISGANTTNPFDPGVVGLATNSDKGTLSGTASVAVGPTQANDLIVGAAYVNNNPTISYGAGYTGINNTAQGGTMHIVSEYVNNALSGSKSVNFTFSANQHWAILADAIVPSSAMKLTISSYTANSAGAAQNTLFTGQSTISLPTRGGQSSTVFAVNGGSVPALGYIEVVMSAPSTSAITIQWGASKPTNFQVAFTYS